ncbi:phospholipase A2 inhibitor subunit gamma B-like [Podarcis lilfordi]|uniref:Phospholipase A2 inhibitor subunit gamma B-like n=1 Tax=Podarcis lilfordi TaxID=74358 RepID=A0AA35KMU3_9SAUR|nr:phospholipase A2 inhibitor subunit gamma B-like [Podarcis lilfordi]
MKPLLGPFFCSLLLTTGTSLQCEVCGAIGKTCSSDKVDCPAGEDTCATYSYAPSPPNINITTFRKLCLTEAGCRNATKDIGKVFENVGLLIKVECNKASEAAPFVFLTLSGLLLMKILL